MTTTSAPDGPELTGHLITGSAASADGMADWASDQGAGAARCSASSWPTRTSSNVPLVAADLYGHFIPDPATGFPQLVLDDGTLVSGHPARTRSPPLARRRRATRSSTTSPTTPRRAASAQECGPDPRHRPGTAESPAGPRSGPTTATARRTTTRCSTRTSSPVTVGSTRTSASRPCTTSSTPSTTVSST